MNIKSNEKWDPLGPSEPLGEMLLAETAIKVELPSYLHQIATARYKAIREYIERDGSPLKDRVNIFYPQGSMAIHATIKSHRSGHDYDIDIVAELTLPLGTPPHVHLDMLFEAINGEPGSRYHGMVKRQTRCVTVEYAGKDAMHLDITPSVLLTEHDPRLSHIFDAKPEEPRETHRALVSNSYAFIDWYREKAPDDEPFRKAYANLARQRFLEADMMFASADAEEVPDQKTLEDGKAAITVALQLLKRNRNIRYDKRDGRMPSSVFLACCAGEVAAPGQSISEALLLLINYVLSKIEAAKLFGQLVSVKNPRCDQDSFTDRWPESAKAQDVFLDDLKRLKKQVVLLTDDTSGLNLEAKQDLLIDMFGEKVAKSAVLSWASQRGKNIEQGDRRVNKKGRVFTPPVIGGLMSGIGAGAARAREHTFYGGRFHDVHDSKKTD